MRLNRVGTVSQAATDTKPTLMLLDGNSLAFRAFYALPAENFKTQGGLTTNAVYGFTAMLINLLRDEKPTHIAAAFDGSRQTFRQEKYPEYKEGRSSTPDEFRGQIDITKVQAERPNLHTAHQQRRQLAARWTQWIRKPHLVAGRRPDPHQ